MIALFFLGILLICFAIWLRQMGRRSSQWPFIRGIIVASELRHTNDDTSVHIAYEYSISGKTYTSNLVSYSGLANASVERDALISRYPVGTKVSVYYDPSNPSRAVLQPGGSTTWRIPMAAGAILAVVGLLYTVAPYLNSA